MFDRDGTRKVLNLISSYDVFTTYKVIDGKLYVYTPNGLSEQARALIREHRNELVTLLTIPPDIEGTCRRGHPVTWVCSEQGIWLCSCYYDTAPEQAIVQSAPRKVRLTWDSKVTSTWNGKVIVKEAS